MPQTIDEFSALKQAIATALQQKFAPTKLEIINESHLHAGHPGAKPGLYHIALNITSAIFCDKTPVQTHRAIYASLGTLMQTHIHALRIQAQSPQHSTDSA